ncbi:MAG: FHA domain-containing protein [Ruminococcaceae bacterium]|nr:FHA domain-containing protein [Oscillospiraceae bacterium]
MPISFDQGGVYEKAIQPVAGWLVCVDGPEKGQDYRIHEQNNYIGRSEKMDIRIAGDPTVSAERHAIIAYDPQSKEFFFGPMSGASIIRRNGKAVLGTEALEKGDQLQIGKCTFLFVPLCGEDFQWS